MEGLGLIDYNDVIKKPMDFSTLRQNVLENVYNNIEAFAYDLRLIFQNCCTYNPPDSYLWVLSRVLLQRTERALLAVFGRSEQIMPSIAKKHDDNNNNNNNNNNIYSPNPPLLPFISFEKNYDLIILPLITVIKTAIYMSSISSNSNSSSSTMDNLIVKYTYEIDHIEEETIDFGKGGANGILWIKKWKWNIL